MDEQRGFLRAITEHPDDDIHRLIFADWLEEHDRPLWADLIRSQCRLTPLLAEDPSPSFWGPGSVEILSLIPRLRADLLAPFSCLRPLLGEPDESLEELLTPVFGLWLQRGLIEGMEIFGGQTVALFTQYAAVIMAEVPVRRLRISRSANRHASPYYSDQAEPVRPPTLRGLLEQEFITRLEVLDLSGLSMRDTGGRILIRARDRLPNLRRLVFEHNQVTPAFAEEIRAEFGEALVLHVPSEDDIPF